MTGLSIFGLPLLFLFFQFSQHLVKPSNQYTAISFFFTGSVNLIPTKSGPQKVAPEFILLCWPNIA